MSEPDHLTACKCHVMTLFDDLLYALPWYWAQTEQLMPQILLSYLIVERYHIHWPPVNWDLPAWLRLVRSYWKQMGKHFF